MKIRWSVCCRFIVGRSFTKKKFLRKILRKIYLEAIHRRKGVFSRAPTIQLSWKHWSSHRRCSVKKLFLKISQISQENTCARVSFVIKLQPPMPKCDFNEVANQLYFANQLYCKSALLKSHFGMGKANTFFHRTPLVAASENITKIPVTTFSIKEETPS